jgi:hypothetical protein
MDVQAKITRVFYDAKYMKRTEIYMTVWKEAQYTLLCDILGGYDEAIHADIILGIATMCTDTVLECTTLVLVEKKPKLLRIGNDTGEVLEQSAIRCAAGTQRKSYYFHLRYRNKEVVVPVLLCIQKTMDRLGFPKGSRGT